MGAIRVGQRVSAMGEDVGATGECDESDGVVGAMGECDEGRWWHWVSAMREGGSNG